MAVTITRTAFTDDDGTGTTGTVINNAVKTELYGQIDAALAALPVNGASLTAHGVVVGNGTGAVAVTGAGAAGQVLTSNGAAADPTYQAAPTFNGVLNALLDISGASAGQIKFPAAQNPSANANTLDDYEEGVWTPVIGGAGGTSGQTYSMQAGYYVKIGRVVHVWWEANLSAKGTITGGVQIQGLPFAATSGRSVYVAGLQYTGLASNWVNVNGVVGQSASAADVFGNQAAAATNQTQLVTADIGNTTDLFGDITYYTAN